MDSKKRASGRSSVVESMRGGFTLAGVRISKEELRRRITMPEYLRLAMREAIQTKDIDSDTVKRHFDMAYDAGADIPQPPEAPIIVFINSKSGGRHGPQLKARLQELMGEQQVSLIVFCGDSEINQLVLNTEVGGKVLRIVN